MTQPVTAPTPAPAPAAPEPPTPQPTPGTPPAPAPSPNPAPSDEPLGPAGKKALDEERAANKALREKLGPLANMDVAPLMQLAQALGGKQTGETKTDLQLLTERMSELEKTGEADRAARFRAEVAHEKGLSAEQAAWLKGSTREELASSADSLLALFPAAAAPRNPAPDPSQGSRGSNPAGDLDSLIAEAQKAGNVREVIRLQKSKLQNVPR